MVSPDHSEAVIALGKHLAEHLKDDGDVAAAWLAHLIAEKILAAEQAVGEARTDAQRTATELILELWRHRAAFPDASRPFGDIAPILRALESLDLGRDERRYFPRSFHGVERTQLPAAGMQWLEFAKGVDELARLTIKLALAAAVETTDGEAEHWAKLAQEAALDDQPGGVVIRVVKPGEATLSDEEYARQDRVTRLKSFISLAQELLEATEAS
jgi:hypothetical protein